MKKQIFCLLLILTGTFFNTPAYCVNKGDVQITCEPGVRVWVDDHFKGKTSYDDNGMYVEGLAPGKHTIKAAKKGYEIVSKTVDVDAGKTIEVKIKFITPSMQVDDITQENDPGTVLQLGHFILRSVPLRAKIYLDGEEIGETDKRISNIPAGLHKLKFVYNDKVLQGEYNLKPNQTLKLKAHFKKMKIINEYDEKFTNTFGMNFVFIPPGSYVPHDAINKKEVYIEGFFMQTTEVTQGQWKAITGKNPSVFKNCGNNCPVENVSYEEVQNYIQILNEREGTNKYRLPKRDEWEYVCRMGRDLKFCYGDDDKRMWEYAWYDHNSRNKTHDVGLKNPSPWGLYDLHGNVMEWCQDFYAELNPVCMGGDYADETEHLKCIIQEVTSPDEKSSKIGFRLIKLP